MQKMKFTHLSGYIAVITIGLIAAHLCAFVSLVQADEIPVSRFNTEGLTGWESKSFKGMTEYQ